MTTPARVSFKTPEDVLGYIPHGLGYWPAESLVVITMEGTRFGATLRLDLPVAGMDTGRRPARSFAQAVAEYLAADASADGSLMALYTLRPWAHPARPPLGNVVKTLSAVLSDAGKPIRDGWLIGGDHWRNYFCSDTSCCPWPGYPNSRITESSANAEMVYRGSSYALSLKDAVELAVPAAAGRNGPLPNPQVAAESEKYRILLGSSWLNEAQFGAALGVWRRAIGSGPPVGVTDDAAAGYLLASLDCKSIRDAVIVLASVAHRVALDGARGHGLLHRDPDAADPVTPVGFVDTADPGPGRPSLAAVRPVPCGPAPESLAKILPVSLSKPANGKPATVNRVTGKPVDGNPVGGKAYLAEAANEFGRILIGDSDAEPDWRTLDNAYQLLSQLLKVSDAGASPALLTILAWMEWARGRGSRADAFLERCLDIAPDYQLAVLLRQLLSRGYLNSWARRRRQAWHPAYPSAA